MVLNLVAVFEIFHLFYIRNIYGTSINWRAIRGTPIVWLVVTIITVAQFAITYLPPLQRIFATRPVPLWEGILIIGSGILFFVMIETEKQIRLKVFPKLSSIFS